ncbi:MAG TPA: flavin reductase family protein [Woeseiaceae bacterium]|nr:flavin reductase family protein [Woeseiaceae bacterium]
MSPNEFDSIDYRRALGCFATGVAVVTALDANGEKIGITVNSFNSVSLNPPLVLWSVGEESLSYAAFVEADYFAVNVLATHQRDLCTQFASSGGDKFLDLECDEGIEGIPLLPEFSAVFECKTEHRYDGGDHKIIVGRVQRFEDRRIDPLIFYRGHFLK